MLFKRLNVVRFSIQNIIDHNIRALAQHRINQRFPLPLDLGAVIPGRDL